jgi:hypothetical protein
LIRLDKPQTGDVTTHATNILDVDGSPSPWGEGRDEGERSSTNPSAPQSDNLGFNNLIILPANLDEP